MNSSPDPSAAIPAGPGWTYLFRASDSLMPDSLKVDGADGGACSGFHIICLTGKIEVQTSLTHNDGTNPNDATQLDSAGLETPGVPAEETFVGRVWQRSGGIKWVRARGVGDAGTAWYTAFSK